MYPGESIIHVQAGLREEGQQVVQVHHGAGPPVVAAEHVHGLPEVGAGPDGLEDQAVEEGVQLLLAGPVEEVEAPGLQAAQELVQGPAASGEPLLLSAPRRFNKFRES